MDNILKKILYRANHRGTKEMDLILGGFASKFLVSLTKEEINQFEKILTFTDKELSQWLIDNSENYEIQKINISKKIKDFCNNYSR
jgi:antitoxin CptB